MQTLVERFLDLDKRLFTVDAPPAEVRLAMFQALPDDASRLRCVTRMEGFAYAYGRYPTPLSSVSPE